MNSVLQGTAADMAKRATLAIHEGLRELHAVHRIHARVARLCLQLHDEIVVEVEQSWVEVVAPMMRRAMETALQAKVPFPVSLKLGPTLGQLQPYECSDLAEAFAEDDNAFSPSSASTSTLTASTPTLTPHTTPSSSTARTASFSSPYRRV